MLVIHVHVNVKPEQVEAFRQATLDNVRHSVREPGIARFDVVQQADDPTRFVLVEAYRTAEAVGAHLRLGSFLASSGRNGLPRGMVAGVQWNRGGGI